MPHAIDFSSVFYGLAIILQGTLNIKEIDSDSVLHRWRALQDGYMLWAADYCGFYAI